MAASQGGMKVGRNKDPILSFFWEYPTYLHATFGDLRGYWIEAFAGLCEIPGEQNSADFYFPMVPFRNRSTKKRAQVW